VPAGIALVLAAGSTLATVGAIVYALSLSGLYGTSAAYHRGHWSPKVRRRMDQADHAMIYVLIAGSYTPLALLALDRVWGVAILTIVWVAAVAGIVVVILWHRIRIFGITMYLSIGWLAVITLPKLALRLGLAEITLMLVGGLFYTVGALVLGYQRPNPKPASG
jgi:hemolysin III